MIAAHFIIDVQTVISREKDPTKFGVVTIGSVQAGNAGNIIPDTALLRGTIRSYDDDTRAKMIEGVERTAKAVAMMAGAPPAGGEDHRGRQGRDQRCRAGDAQRRGAEGGVWREGVICCRRRARPARTFRNSHGRRAVVLLRHRRPRPQGRRPGDGDEYAAAGQPLAEFAPVPEPTIRTGTVAMSLVLLDVLQKK